MYRWTELSENVALKNSMENFCKRQAVCMIIIIPFFRLKCYLLAIKALNENHIQRFLKDQSMLYF